MSVPNDLTYEQPIFQPAGQQVPGRRPIPLPCCLSLGLFLLPYLFFFSREKWKKRKVFESQEQAHYTVDCEREE